MSIAEIFLMSWAVLATVYGVWVHSRAKHYYHAHKGVSILIAELAYGDIEPTQDDNGVWTVENEAMRIQFRRKEM